MKFPLPCERMRAEPRPEHKLPSSQGLVRSLSPTEEQGGRKAPGKGEGGRPEIPVRTLIPYPLCQKTSSSNSVRDLRKQCEWGLSLIFLIVLLMEINCWRWEHLENWVTCKLSITGSFLLLLCRWGDVCLNGRSRRNSFNVYSAFSSLVHSPVFFWPLPPQNTCICYFRIHHPPIS